jgi:serine protease AprX
VLDVMKLMSISCVVRTFALGAVLLAIAAPVQAGNRRVDPVVDRAIKNGRGLPVIVTFNDEDSLKRGKQALAGQNAGIKHIKSLRALAVNANHRILQNLLDDKSVKHISYDSPVRSTVATGVSIDATGSKVARNRYDINGAGVTVAVIDSGVQPHADLPATRIKAFVDFVNGRRTPYDDYGHGTHVAGIIAGSGAASSGKYTGVAPGASIVALKVLDGNGGGSTSNVMAALDWVATNAESYKIRIVNLSLGHPVFESAITDPLVRMVDQLSLKGIVVVVAAGNMGRNSLGQTVYGSITSPGNAQGAITVGATNTNSTTFRSDDSVAAFSSRGPTRFEYYAKPDVVAPGQAIVSLAAPSSTLSLKYPDLLVSGGYVRLNGTSMAAPVVAGEAALMLNANPSLSAHTVKAAIQFTAQRLPGVDAMSQGIGEVNVAGAARLARLIRTDAQYGKRWVLGLRRPVQADLLFGETVYWGSAIIWGHRLSATNSVYVRLAQWNDNIVWGVNADNIVWGFDDKMIWSLVYADNIVWGVTADNIVWANNIVWGLTDDNIVWGFDDNIGWDVTAENIVWGMMNDNIVWSMGFDAVMAFSDSLTDGEGQ